jgi:hypothetical protein
VFPASGEVVTPDTVPNRSPTAQENAD